MGLNTVIGNAVKTIFTVFTDLSYVAIYHSATDDGFSSVVTTDYSVQAILDEWTTKDTRGSLASFIQPTDTKCLLRGSDISFTIGPDDTITVDGNVFSVITYATDPAKALYTLVLRKV